MTQAAISNSHKEAPASAGKWGQRLSAKDSTGKVAFTFLETALEGRVVRSHLAAERSQEDVEYVHQLRITTRRAAGALRVFSNLIPKATYEDLRASLRKIRLAADEARNWDVSRRLVL